MSDKPINYFEIGDGIKFNTDHETWVKTSDLRWFRSKDAGSLTQSLQQRWFSSKGNVKWEDVPTVEVDSE